METVLKRFGLRKGVPRESEARLKLQKELFAYNTCVEHGFPNKPSALAYDPHLRLLAIGTKNGAIRVLGAPGVEFSGQHKEDIAVTNLLFLIDQGRLISQCSDNSLHLWEISSMEDGGSEIKEVRSLNIESSKLKTISSVCLARDSEKLLLGTEGGNIHMLNVYSFKLSEDVVYQEAITNNVPDDFKVNPGAVETIVQSPTHPNKFLIGYNRGLIILYDSTEGTAEQTYNAGQQLESLAWNRDGAQFLSAHADGSFITWSTTDSTKPKEQANTPYGPFPCKSITQIKWETAKVDPYVIFSGGMPRASYGDRHTVTAMQGSMHQVFDFTSRVVDFLTLNTADELDSYDKIDYDDPHTLVVLAEEELVAIDLTSEGWQAYRTPYLNSLHSSAITCATHVANLPDALWDKISQAGEQQQSNTSSRDWPVSGGKDLVENVGTKDVLLTGHEDGSVRFWDASSTAMRLMYKLTTANMFGCDVSGEQAEEEEWPPFRKVGSFDPYSDDPRLGIQKIFFCPLSETLVVGGTAGQVLVFNFERESREQEVRIVPLNLVSDREGFVWKGHGALPVTGGDLKFAAGFQPVCVVQLQPPAACTALAVNSEWQLAAAGTAHGFGIFDYAQRVALHTNCTLNPADMTGTGESAMSRRKSFKKSLRESFRRLRRRRSERQPRSPKKERVEEEKKDETSGGDAAASSSEAAGGAAGSSPPASPAKSPSADTPTKSVERSVEARATDDTMASMVRSLYFADTFLISGQSHTPTLWAGTNAGKVFIYQVTLPSSDKRDAEQVNCQLAKEIHLKHHAPVVFMCVLDRHSQPLPAPLEVQNERARAPDMSGNHTVLIVSEEQFKIFALPNLKANNKYKLTASEGSKVRRTSFVTFRSKSDDRYVENDLAILTNMGEAQVFTVPSLRRQIKAECIRKDNVSGIVSGIFTQNGEGFFLASPSEFMRFSLSARNVNHPVCEVEIEDGARPPLPEQEPEVEAPADTEAEPAEAQAAGDAEQTDAAAGDTAAAPETEVAPATGESGEGDGEAAGGGDESLAVADADTSLASADITKDSITVHLSEATSSTTQREMTVVSSSRTIVTRTVVSEKHTEGGVVTHEETKTVREMSSTNSGPVVEVTTTTVTSDSANVPAVEDAAPAAAAAEVTSSGGENADGETRVREQSAEEVSESLPVLHITEDGDDIPNITITSPTTPAPSSPVAMETAAAAES